MIRDMLHELGIETYCNERRGFWRLLNVVTDFLIPFFKPVNVTF
jgi:hypothetical protein